MIKTDFALLADQLASRYSLKSSLMIMRDLDKRNVRELITHITDSAFLSQLKTRLQEIELNTKYKFIDRLVRKQLDGLKM